MSTINEKMTSLANEIKNLNNINETMGLNAMISHLNIANSQLDE